MKESAETPISAKKNANPPFLHFGWRDVFAIRRAAYQAKLPALIATLFLAALHVCYSGHNVTLAWDANPEPDIEKYKVYYRLPSGGPSESREVGNVTTATVENLNERTTYLFTVTAINHDGLESGPSNEVSYTTPTGQEPLYLLTVNFGTGGGRYRYADEVRVSASPEPGDQFAHWDGDRDILANFMSANTTARILRMEDLTITAVYKYAVTVNNGTGDGNYFAGDPVQIVANAASAGQQFAGWTGTDNVTLANASSLTTTFTMPSSQVTVTANYKVSDRIRYYPRSGYRSRMVSGVFEGTNDPANGYKELHKISATPPQAWTAINVNLEGYKYLRYRTPDGSYGNVAEIEFYRNGVKIKGTGFGTAGSYMNNGRTFRRALDANTSTYFDGPTANGNYVGIIAE